MSLRIYGNRQLKTVSGSTTRPTSARVREALFNIWPDAGNGSRWLDLCAGSGAIGAEALCRGAALVVGIEQSSRACEVIRQNWQQVATTGQQFQLLRGNIKHRLNALAGQQFDYIYFDPPYTSSLYDWVLPSIIQWQLLAPEGELAVEHATRPKPPATGLPIVPGLVCCRQRQYGETSLSFFCLDQNQISDASATPSLEV